MASSATPNSGTSQPSNGGTQGSSASHGSPASSAPTGSAGSGSATGSQASGSAPGPSESTVAPSSGTGASSGVPASGASASGASASSKVSVSSGAPASSQIPTSSSAPGTLGRTTGGSVLSGVSASAIPSASAGLSESSSIATSSEASASPGVSAPSGSGTTSSETSASPGGTASYGDTTSPEGTVSPGGTTNSGVKTTNSGGTASSGESASSSSGVQVSSGASTPSGVSIASALPGSSGATSVPQSPESSASSGSAVSPWGAGTSSSPRTPASGQSSAATSTKASGSLASSAVPASGGSTSPVSASSQAGHSSQPSLGSSASPSPSGESQISPGASAGSDQSSVTRTGLGSSNAHTASGTGVSQSTGGSEAPPSPSITGPASTTSEPIASSPVPESASIANMSAAYFVPSQLSGTAPMITCTPPCRLVIPPWCFTTPKVFTFPPITTTLQVIGDTVSQSGSATVTGLKTVNETTVVTPSPITTTCLQYFNVNITNGSATVINPIISMVPTPFVITDSMPSGMFPVSGTTRTFTPPPQSIQSTMSGGAIMGWGSLQYGSGGSGVYTGTCNSLICGEVCQFWCPTGNLPCIFCYTIEIPGLWWPTWTIPDPNAPPCLVGCGEGGGGGSNPQSEGGEPQSSAGSEGESSTATSSSSSCMTTLTAPEVLVSCFTNNVTSSCQTISSIQVTGCDLSPTTTTEYATSTPSCATEMTAQEAFVTCFSMVPNGTTSGMEFCQTANATQITGCSVTATATTQYAFCPWIDPDDQGACGDNSTIANSTMTNSTFMTNTTTGSCATTLTVPDILVSCFSMNVTVNGTNAVCETMSSVQVTGCDVTAAATTEFAACPTIDLDDQGECGNDTMLSNMTMTNTTMSSTATNTSSSTGCATPLTVQDYVVSCFSLNSTAFCETASATNVTGCGVTAAATTTYAACPLLDPDDDQGEDGGNVTMPYNVSTGSSHTLHFDTTTAGYSMGPVSIPASWTGSTGTVVFGMYTVVYPGSTNTTVIKPRPTSGGFDADCPLPEIGAAIVEHRETTGTTGTFASIITDILVFPTGMCDWKGYWECPQNAANGHNGMYCTQTEAPPAQPIYCEQPPGPPRVTHGSYNSTTFEATLGLTCIGPKSCGLPCSVPFETPVSASHTSRTSLPFSWGLYQMIYTEHNDDYPDPYTMPPMIQPFPLLTCVGNSSARAAFVPDSTTGPATPRQTTTTPNEANEAKAFTGTLNWPRGMCDITTAISCLPQPPVSPTGYTCYNQEDSTGDFSCFKWAWHGSCSWTDSWTVTASASLGFICTGGPNCETYPPADPLIHPTSSSKFIPPPKQPAPTAANSTLQRRINKVVDYAEAICKGDMVLAGLESGNVPQSQFLSYDAITEHYQILINVGTFDDVFDSIWRDLGITDKNKLQGWAAIVSTNLILSWRHLKYNYSK